MGGALAVTLSALMLLEVAVRQNTSYVPDINWAAPPKAAIRKNPLAAEPGTTAGGKKLFRRNCVECHGNDGSGLIEKHSADLHLPVVQSQSDGVLFWKITNGNPDRGMPSFSRLPDLQRWQLVLYLRTFKEPSSL